MLKKTISFEDLDGNPVSEEFYFHLSKADIAEMELSEKGGLTKYINRIVAEEDGKKLVAIFKELIVRTIGKRHEDGRQFIRNKEITDAFVQSNAYSELFIELATDAEKAAEFINGVVPQSMHDEVKKASAENFELPATSDSTASTTVQEPSWITERRAPTEAEVRAATPEQLRMAFQFKQEQSKPNVPDA